MQNHIHMYNSIIHMSTYMYMYVLCSTHIQSVGSRVVECTFHYLHVHSCLISVYIRESVDSLCRDGADTPIKP